MLCYAPLLVFVVMIVATAFLTILGVFLLQPYPTLQEIQCPDGRSCPGTWHCCELGCCAPSTIAPHLVRREEAFKEYVLWDYYNWPILFVIATLIGIFLCGLYCICLKSTQYCSCIFACCLRRHNSDLDSSGSCYPPPHYSRCGSFHQAPPPYSEVTSKPDLYPLVITCGEGENKNSGNYFMVHYFRNYMNPHGSLSATSTAESLNSNFVCNVTNETNAVVPPPYSRSSNYDDWPGGRGALLRSLSSLAEARALRAPPRSLTAPPDPPEPPVRSPDDTFRETLITSPVQPVNPSYDLELELIDYELCCETGCRPKLGPSPPVHRSPSNNDEGTVFEQDFEKLRHLYNCPSPDNTACESPPQPTSPTQTSRDSTLRRAIEEKRQRRSETVKKCLKRRKSSLYMPLTSGSSAKTSKISPGAKASSRSAPATPCGALVPNLLALTQRVSASRLGSKSSKLDEENNPLLTDECNVNSDHKF